jgi:Domain of unknown function (DUF5615)
VRFTGNENIPLAAVKLLRERAHDVAAIAEEAAGVDDGTVLERAARDQRIIPTFDRDYGELLFRRGLPPRLGLIYFRLDPSTPLAPTEHVLCVAQACRSSAWKTCEPLSGFGLIDSRGPNGPQSLRSSGVQTAPCAVIDNSAPRAMTRSRTAFGRSACGRRLR